MGRAKAIVVKPISSADANRVIRAIHYSGKIVQNSQVHFGVFLDGACGGALQFGPSLDKRKLCGLVKGTKWNEFLELNRMALADWLPPNSESRAISVTLRIMRKAYPWIKWVVSFADATQCGDGTIYRASGFVLTLIKRNVSLARLPNGVVIHEMTLKSQGDVPVRRILGDLPGIGDRTFCDITGGSNAFAKFCRAVGATPVEGYQLRYVYFLHREERANLSVPEIPFAEIEARGAGMYKGARRAGSIDG